jgi:hypothetical protein
VSGASVITPFGPLGLDYAYGLDRLGIDGRREPKWHYISGLVRSSSYSPGGPGGKSGAGVPLGGPVIHQELKMAHSINWLSWGR